MSTRLTDRLDNPASLDPLQTSAGAGLNEAFAGAQKGLERRLAGRGFGSSGKLVTNSKDLAIKRAGAFGDLESKFAALKVDQGNKAIDQAQQFAFGKSGTSSTGTTPGDPLGGAVAGGAETATLLYALNHFMNKGDGGSVGDVSGGPSTYTGGDDLLRQYTPGLGSSGPGF